LINEFINKKIKFLLIFTLLAGTILRDNYYTSPHMKINDILLIFIVAFLGIFLILTLQNFLDFKVFPFNEKLLFYSGLLMIAGNIIPFFYLVLSGDRYFLDGLFVISGASGVILATLLKLKK